MKKIVFTRIDDRLIHGQVMTAWIAVSQADEVLIIDDVVAKDDFTKMIMQASMPKKIKLTVLGTEEAIEYLKKDGSESIFLLIKTPKPILAVMNAGIKVAQVCVGGMGAKANRTPFYRNISASDEEREDLLQIQKLGADVYAQVLSDNTPVTLNQILGK